MDVMKLTPISLIQELKKLKTPKQYLRKLRNHSEDEVEYIILMLNDINPVFNDRSLLHLFLFLKSKLKTKLIFSKLSYENSIGYGETWTFDERGNHILYEDSDGFRKTMTYDERDNMLTQEDSVDYKVWYTYDENNNKIREINSRGKVINYTYDDRGNLLSYEDSYGDTEYYSYDDNDNMVINVNILGSKIIMTYDERGNMLSHEHSNGEKQTWTYDEHDNILSHETSDGYKRIWIYDGKQISFQDFGDTNPSIIYEEEIFKLDYEKYKESKNLFKRIIK